MHDHANDNNGYVEPMPVTRTTIVSRLGSGKDDDQSCGLIQRIGDDGIDNDERLELQNTACLPRTDTETFYWCVRISVSIVQHASRDDSCT